MKELKEIAPVNYASGLSNVESGEGIESHTGRVGFPFLAIPVESGEGIEKHEECWIVRVELLTCGIR